MITSTDSTTPRSRVIQGLIGVFLMVASVGITASPAAAIEFETLGVSATDLAGQPERQAGAHPDIRLRFSAERFDPADPDSTVKELSHRLVTELPAGLAGNPLAAPTCPETGLRGGPVPQNPICPVGSQIGTASVLSPQGTGGGPRTGVPLYNIEPPAGAPAMFAFNFAGVVVKLTPRVRATDHGITIDTGVISQGMTVGGADVTVWGVPADPVHDAERYASSFGGYAFSPPAQSQSPRKPFLTVGTSCPGAPDVTTVHMDGWQSIGAFASRSLSSDFDGLPFVATGCDALAFEPTAEVGTTSRVADAPTGLDVRLKVPQSDAPDGLATAHVKDVSMVLPAGMSVSPSSANGLEACSDAQIGLGSDGVEHCPRASKLGTVEIETPVLEKPLSGSMYLGTQESDDPMSGRMFRLFIVAEGSGVRVKLEGGATAHPDTGRVTATFKHNPQLPFSELRVKLFGGPSGPLATPAACGTSSTTVDLSSWSGKAVTQTSPMTVDCRSGLGAFSPSLTAGTVNPAAGASSPFVLRVDKPDGQSVVDGLRMSLPIGLLGQLKGNVGTQVGSVTAYAGPGSSPFALPGRVYLEGAYGDAPFSLRVVVPAKAGPFDLGAVEVRQKIYVDPVTAQVTVVSDPLPTIVKGVPVRLQRLDVNIDKPGFIVNPTSCAPKAFGGTLSAVDRQTAPINVRFQAAGCAGLGYEPKLEMAMVGKGQTKDGSHPALTARLTPPAGNANTKKTTVTLPLALALDPGNANGLCEPADAARNACPANTIVGSAQAESVLPDTLKGPVYFVRGERIDSKGKVRKTLPKLFIPLSANGVTIYVNASSDVEDDRLVTTFDNLPDAPFSSFELNINGGKHGILAVSNTDVCAATNVADAEFGGQNGKVHTSEVMMGTPCALDVVKSSRTQTALKLTIGGLGAGKVSGSGNGVVKSSRTLTSATTATLSLKLSDATRRALAQGRDVKVKVKVAFTAKGQKKAKTATKSVVIHGAKKR